MHLSIKQSFIVCMVLHRMSAGWFFGTYMLFLLSHGLTQLEANTVNTVFMLSNTVLESPTGYLADRFGQKKAHLLGLCFWGAGMLVYGLNDTISGFMLAEATAALGASFVSGALSSWVQNQTDNETARHARSEIAMFGPIASIPTAILGGYIGATWGFGWPRFIACVHCFVTVVVTAVILMRHPETRYVRENSSVPNLKAIYRLVFAHSELRFVLFLNILLSFAFQPFNMFWAPIFFERSGGAWWLGSVWAGVAVTTAYGARLSKKRWFLGNGGGIALLVLSAGLPMAISSFMPGVIPLVLLFFLHEIGRGALGPVVENYSNGHISNEVRSTCNSILSQAHMVGAAAGLWISGLLTEYLTRLEVWGMSGSLLLALAVWAYFRTKR